MSCLVEEYNVLYDIQTFLDTFIEICTKVSEAKKLFNLDAYHELAAFYIYKSIEIKNEYNYLNMSDFDIKRKEKYRKVRGSIVVYVSEAIKEILGSVPLLDRRLVKKMRCLLALCLYFVDESFVTPFPYLE